jgi:quercetin dioxygenase-like cupin family protein
MHHVTRIDAGAARTPKRYREHSAGFRRFDYVDRSVGSVHMGVGICLLDAGGHIEPHVHAYEESFYVLDGGVLAQIGEQAVLLGPGDYGLIPTGQRHAWRGAGRGRARWLEMAAPQPRRIQDGRDTFFVDGAPPAHATRPTLPDAAMPLLGHFDESQLPRPGGPSQMEGFNPITGVAIKMFVDRSLGAVHQSLFLIQYMPGAKIDPHDHTFEESYLIVQGVVEATADGKTYRLGPGDVIWTGVGCIHAFANTGTEPVRWIETQAPLPPAKEIFRFERDWVQYTTSS